MLTTNKNLILLGIEQKVRKLQRTVYGFTGGGNYDLPDISAMCFGNNTILEVDLEDNFTVGELGKYNGIFYQKMVETSSGVQFTPEFWREASATDLMFYMKLVEDVITAMKKEGNGLIWGRLAESMEFRKSLISSNGIKPNGYDSAVIVDNTTTKNLYENNVIGLEYHGNNGLYMKHGTGSSANIVGDVTNVYDVLSYNVASTGMTVDDCALFMSFDHTTFATGKTLLSEVAYLDTVTRYISFYVEGGQVKAEIEVDDTTTEIMSLPYEIVGDKLHISLVSILGEVAFRVGKSMQSLPVVLSASPITKWSFGYSDKYVNEANVGYFTGALVGASVGTFSVSRFNGNERLLYNYMFNGGFDRGTQNGEERQLQGRAFSGRRSIVDEELENLTWTTNETNNAKYPTIVNDQDFSKGELGKYNGVIYYKRNNLGGLAVNLDNWTKFSLKGAIETLEARDSVIRTYLDTASMIADTSLQVGTSCYIPLEFKSFEVVATAPVDGHTYETLDNGNFAQLESYTKHLNTMSATEGDILRYDGVYFNKYKSIKSRWEYQNTVTPISILANSTTNYLEFDTEYLWSSPEVTLDTGLTDSKFTVDPIGTLGRHFQINITVLITPLQVGGDTLVDLGFEYSVDGGSTWLGSIGEVVPVLDTITTGVMRANISFLPDNAMFRISITADKNVELIALAKNINGVNHVVPACIMSLHEVI